MKKVLVTIFTVTALFLGMNEVMASNYNGSSGGGPIPNSGCPTSNYTPCLFYNNDYKAVKMTLVYYDGRNIDWNVAKNSYFVLSNRGGYASDVKKNLIDRHGLAHERGDYIWTYDSSARGGWRLSAENIKAHLIDSSNAKANLNRILKGMGLSGGVSDSRLNKPSQTATGNINRIGYRIIIEPIISATRRNSRSDITYYTVKEFFKGDNTNNGQNADTGWMLHTVYDDIGVSKAVWTGDRGEMQKERTGNGYNIIDITRHVDQNECYRVKDFDLKDAPKCINTNKQNIGSYNEVYEKIECKDGTPKEEKEALVHGKRVRTVAGTCRIYCKESVAVKFPGSISPAMKTGTHFVWPTIGNTINDVNKLEIEGKRICRAITDAGADCIGQATNVTADQLYGNFKRSVTVGYNGKDYKSDIQLVVDKETSNISRSGNEITVTRNVQLKLPDNTYRFVNKESGKSVSSIVGGISYTNIGYGNLPISSTEVTGKDLKLELKNIELGANNSFGKAANKVPYVCNYRTTKDNPSCVCPPGTANAGKQLWDTMICGPEGSARSGSETGLNCATAQSKYCNRASSEFDALSDMRDSEEVCDDPEGKSKYCPEPNEHISLEACVNAGTGYEKCKKRLCDGSPPRKYECPGNSPTNPYMDISPCVETKMAQGYRENEAIHVCQGIVCPGTEIIYRTINLANPFPSKELNAGIVGFNRDVAGRYPGYNWNSTALVGSRILGSRGFASDGIYSAPPLYVITLDRATMLSIRDYNRRQLRAGNGYADFTLNCLNEDGSVCISREFLRNIAKIDSGTCARATTRDAFGHCTSWAASAGAAGFEW